MKFSNSKAQAGNVLIAVFLVLLVGLILYSFSPVIDDLRQEAINDLNSESNVLYEIFLYSMMPVVWFLYLFVSVVWIAITSQASGGGI